MTTLEIIACCAAHTPAEVEYVCSSFLWSALWWCLGFVTAMCVRIFLGGSK